MDVSQYLEIFIDETQEHIQELNDNILILENEPENSDVVNEIFRAAHSLKGMAGTMGFKRMQRLTHDMENVFQEIRSENLLKKRVALVPFVRQNALDCGITPPRLLSRRRYSLLGKIRRYPGYRFAAHEKPVDQANRLRFFRDDLRKKRRRFA